MNKYYFCKYLVLTDNNEWYVEGETSEDEYWDNIGGTIRVAPDWVHITEVTEETVSESVLRNLVEAGRVHYE